MTQNNCPETREHNVKTTAESCQGRRQQYGRKKIVTEQAQKVSNPLYLSQPKNFSIARVVEVFGGRYLLKSECARDHYYPKVFFYCRLNPSRANSVSFVASTRCYNFSTTLLACLGGAKGALIVFFIRVSKRERRRNGSRRKSGQCFLPVDAAFWFWTTIVALCLRRTY